MRHPLTSIVRTPPFAAFFCVPVFGATVDALGSAGLGVFDMVKARDSVYFVKEYFFHNYAFRSGRVFYRKRFYHKIFSIIIENFGRSGRALILHLDLGYSQC